MRARSRWARNRTVAEHALRDRLPVDGDQHVVGNRDRPIIGPDQPGELQATRVPGGERLQSTEFLPVLASALVDLPRLRIQPQDWRTWIGHLSWGATPPPSSSYRSARRTRKR